MPDELKPLSRDDVEKVAGAYIDECIDFRDADLQPSRIKLDRYYQGKVDLEKPEGRSEVIVSSVRDGVRSVIPSLARIFTQTDEVAEFYSSEEEDQRICSDATKYCNNVFWSFGGYKALIEGCTDSLKAKLGVIKVTLQDKQYVSHISYDTSKLNGAELPNITEANEETQVQTNKTTRQVWAFEPLPPEEFLVHHSATCIEYAVACAHQREETVSNLIQMGFAYDDLKDIPASGSLNTEDKERKKTFRERDEGSSANIDPSAKLIMFTEAYVRIDADGDGIAELRRICLGGEHKKLLSDEPVNYAPYSEFTAEIAPHVMYPICLAEDLVQDQDAQTALLRSIIDNVAYVNNPRTLINERFVNIEDAKNGRIGAIIRTREMGTVEELTTPPVAVQTLQVLQYLQEVQERRSGITKLNQGLDPDALQSSSRIAAQAAITASDARIEMMARNIAETGVKNMFKCILKTAIYSIKKPQSIPQPQGFRMVDPSMWHLYMNIRTKVGLGSGRIDEKKAILGTVIMPLQEKLIAQYGPMNPISGWKEARETVKDLLRLNGISDYQRYFPYVDDQKMQQFVTEMDQKNSEAQKKQQQAQEAQQNAMMGLVKVESEKAQLKYESNLQNMKTDFQTKMMDLQAKIHDMQARNTNAHLQTILVDDRERDKNDMNFIIDSKKVALEDDKIDVAREKIEADRQAPNGATVQ